MGVFGRAQGEVVGRSAGGGAGRELGHHPLHRAAGRFQGLQRGAQPGPVAHRDPGGRAGAGPGLQREMQRGGIVQQALFEQPFEHGAQARRLRAGTGRQGDALPRQGACRHHGHHLAGAARVGQQRGGRVRVSCGGVAVGGQRVAVLGGRPRVARGQGKDEGAHGWVSRAILGAWHDGSRGRGQRVAVAASLRAKTPRSRHSVRASRPAL